MNLPNDGTKSERGEMDDRYIGTKTTTVVCEHGVKIPVTVDYYTTESRAFAVGKDGRCKKCREIEKKAALREAYLRGRARGYSAGIVMARFMSRSHRRKLKRMGAIEYIKKYPDDLTYDSMYVW